MRLFNLGFFLSALYATQERTIIDSKDIASFNSTIMGASCLDQLARYTATENPQINVKYKIGTVQLCGGKWYVGFLHWKSFSHGWPGNIFPTGSWGVAQDNNCDARNKAYVTIQQDGSNKKFYDPERSKTYAYFDDNGRPYQSGSAICTLSTCYTEMDFIDGRFDISHAGKYYRGFKWRKNRAASNRQWMDLRCSGDDMYSTGDIRESFFFLLR